MKKISLSRDDLDKVRNVEGFPLGTDEDIINISSAPQYTAFPNTFIRDYIQEHGTIYDESEDDYQCEPFAADVSEGKSDAIYNAHTYHTKVPYKAIMRYILHYTKPGDIVLDGFCGTGMTGVAANMCEHPESQFKQLIERDMPEVKWGRRYPVLNDLAPIATFISKNYNADIDVAYFSKEAELLLKKAYEECSWMFKTKHDDGAIRLPGMESWGEINYTVWSDVFICPNCGKEIVFYEAAADPNTGKVKAMVSYPSYDNNKFANSVDSEYFAKINSNSASPFLNRATQQKTAPGSTYKMVSATAALEEGVIDPGSTVTDHVVFDKINPSPKCWSTYSHGTINVSQAIQHSCNYFFYEMGYRLSGLSGTAVNNERGLKKLEKYADKYGLTDLSGVELTEAQPHVSDSDAVRSAIGQGTNSYTPVQLSRYVSTISNGGTCYDLTLVDKVADSSQNNKIKNNKAKVRNELDIKSSTLNAIRRGMYMVVNNGSLKSVFQKVPVKVAGKTGTAQISANEPNHALFVSYAPYDSPKISVTVVMPNAFTSSNAASLASNVYQYYFDEKARKKLLKKSATSPVSNSGRVAD